jgi:hypothetical protein
MVFELNMLGIKQVPAAVGKSPVYKDSGEGFGVVESVVCHMFSIFSISESNRDPIGSGLYS